MNIRNGFLMLLLLVTIICITSGTDKAQTLPQSALPQPDHIVVVILENHAYSSIYNSSSATYINSLAADQRSAVLTSSYAIEHPSQPNYLDLFSGSNQGVTDDALPAGQPFTTDNLARELIDVGKTFTTYSEDLPSVGFNGTSSGNYARKHNPAANWMGTDVNGIVATTNQPFTAFPTDFTTLPTVCYVVPNQNDDMHNGTDPSTIVTGDNWVKKRLDAYIQWAKSHNSLLILTFDEDDDAHGNQILTIFTGQMVNGGAYSEQIDHFSVLRTIEDIYQLRHAGSAAAAIVITDIWAGSWSVGENKANGLRYLSLSSNPVRSVSTIHYSHEQRSLTHVAITNLLGLQVAQIFNGNLESGEHSFTLDASNFLNGIYFCAAVDGSSASQIPFIVEH